MPKVRRQALSSSSPPRGSGRGKRQNAGKGGSHDPSIPATSKAQGKRAASEMTQENDDSSQTSFHDILENLTENFKPLQPLLQSLHTSRTSQQDLIKDLRGRIEDLRGRIEDLRMHREDLRMHREDLRMHREDLRERIEIELSEKKLNTIHGAPEVSDSSSCLSEK